MTDRGNIRDAAACGRLVFVTGAGISTGMQRSDGSNLPKWGDLVQQLRHHRTSVDPDLEPLLDELLPARSLDQLHGDVLIEASEIISKGYERAPIDKFAERLADLCREVPNSFTETHRAIAETQPAGIITFNYDCGHESAYRSLGADMPDKLLYNDDTNLRTYLGRMDKDTPFLLKAHGCIDTPSSPVLTSSSYREILRDCRAYRAFLHRILVTYSVVIVGFAMRDRDFDQLLLTLEVELGGPVQHLAVLAMEPGRDSRGEIERANWATLKSRFGVEPFFVSSYLNIPDEIRRLASTPGPLIEQLALNSVSAVKAVRMVAHDQAKGLGPVGRAQLRSTLIEVIGDPSVSLESKSEAIYALGSVSEGSATVADALLKFLESIAAQPAPSLEIGHAECVAHALLVLRASRPVDTIMLTSMLTRMNAPSIQQCLRVLDAKLALVSGSSRLEKYAVSAAAEITARTLS